MFGGGGGLKRKHVCMTALLYMFLLPLLSHGAQSDIFPQRAAFNRRKEVFLFAFGRKTLLWMFPFQSGTDNTARWEI